MLTNKHYIYKCIILLLISFVLTACSNSLPKDSKEIKNIKEFIQNSCPLNKEVDTNKDIIVATLYYKQNSVSLSLQDKMILQQVITLFQACNNKILVLGYASNKEAKQSPIIAANLSYFRAYNAYAYLKKSIPYNSLYYEFCSNLRNKFKETNSTASFGNQRVEIIMLGKGVSSNYLTCIKGKK